MTISLCMIVRDEEAVLERCLNSIKDVVDEIVIVDTGSKDNTVEIAKRFTNNVYFFEWIDDFATARNYSFSKGTKDYLMWFDADDVMFEEDREKLLRIKENNDLSVDVLIQMIKKLLKK